MKLAILSDIHDNVWQLAATLRNLQDADALICCGDLCSPFIVSHLADGFPNRPIHIVFGNNDGDLFRIAESASEYKHVQVHGEYFEGDLGGKRFAVNHYPDIARAIALAEKHDVVCYGHSHAFNIEPVGNTLTINPGALMGYDPINNKDIPATFVIYNTVDNTAMGYEVMTAVACTIGTGKTTPYPSSISIGRSTMANNIGRNQVWTADIEGEIQKAVQTEVGQIRVAQKVFPSTPFPTGQPVPDDRLIPPAAGQNRLRIEEGRTKPFIEISRELCLTQSQVEHEPTLTTGRKLARMAARNIAQAEDMIIFHGSRSNVDPLGVSANVRPGTRGLWELAKSPLRRLSIGAVGYPGTIFAHVAQGISYLVRAMQPGPYALFLSPNIYAATFAPVGGAAGGGLVTTADRIQPLVPAGFYSTGALQTAPANVVAGEEWAAAARDGEVVEAVAAAPDPAAAADLAADPRFAVPAEWAAAAHAPIGAAALAGAPRAAGAPPRDLAGAAAAAGAPIPNAPPNPLVGLGLLVSLGGEPTTIYVGTDATMQFTQLDNEGNACFRVFERFQFVVRDPQALVRLEFVA